MVDWVDYTVDTSLSATGHALFEHVIGSNEVQCMLLYVSSIYFWFIV